MSEQDPMLGSAEEQAQYKRQIMEMIQQDIEQRQMERIAEFQRSRESSAVLQGAVGLPGSGALALQ